MVSLGPLYRVVLLVVALMSGILSLVREGLQIADPSHYSQRPLFFACLRVACILAFSCLWFEERRARKSAESQFNSKRPALDLQLATTVWTYDQARQVTAFFIGASLLNRGEPTVVLNWRATYRIGTSVEPMTRFHINGDYSVQIGNQELILNNANLLPLRVLEQAIGRGQFIAGRVLLAIPGNRKAQVEALQFSIDVECEDYLGTVSKATYTPSSIPLEHLETHHAERVRLVQSAPSAPQEASQPRPTPAPAPQTSPSSKQGESGSNES